MRERTVNEKAVSKTMRFLEDLQAQSGMPDQNPISLLYSHHRINKSTGSVCVRLGFIKIENHTYHWLKGEAAPTREDVLMILEDLRRRNDKQVLVPLAGFERLVDNLGALAERLGNQHTTAPAEQRMLHRALNQATPSNQTLFSEADKKRDDLIKIVCAVATGLYSDKVSNWDILNESILEISQDLLTKIYNTK